MTSWPVRMGESFLLDTDGFFRRQAFRSHSDFIAAELQVVDKIREFILQCVKKVLLCHFTTAIMPFCLVYNIGSIMSICQQLFCII